VHRRTSLVHAYHDFRDPSPSGVLGDPSLASEAKVERILRACVEGLPVFLLDFVLWPIG
jgi:creatinine amidohydrolase/Fe(II)-dependent formamide hydrolase-like protein